MMKQLFLNVKSPGNCELWEIKYGNIQCKVRVYNEFDSNYPELGRGCGEIQKSLTRPGLHLVMYENAIIRRRMFNAEP